MKIYAAACLAILLTGACQSSGERADAKIDARQGKEVSQVCFSQQIRNWSALNSSSVIVEKGLKEKYKLDVVGGCRPDDAFTTIGLVSRFGGGSCLSTGDKLVTDARYDFGACTIHRIYEWNEDAKPADEK